MIHIDIIIPERFSYKENRHLLIDIIKNAGGWLSELRRETNLGELYDLEIRLREVNLCIQKDKTPIYYTTQISYTGNYKIKYIGIFFTYNLELGAGFRNKANIIFKEGISLPQYSVIIEN